MDSVDGSPRDTTDMTSDQRPKDIVEQLREFREAVKPKTLSTNGNFFIVTLSIAVKPQTSDFF